MPRPVPRSPSPFPAARSRSTEDAVGPPLESAGGANPRKQRGGTGRQSGAGLGLSLVKRLIELHGGSIDLASETGQGTRISCFIPESPTQLAAPAEPEALQDAPMPAAVAAGREAGVGG